MVFRMGVGFEVGDIVADPPMGVFVPPDLPTLRIPRLTRRVTGGAVVQNAAIGRPRPCPVRIDTQAGGIFGAAPRELRSGFGPGAGIDPVAAGRSAVVSEPCETRQLLTRLNRLICRGIGYVGIAPCR